MTKRAPNGGVEEITLGPDNRHCTRIVLMRSSGEVRGRTDFVETVG